MDLIERVLYFDRHSEAVDYATRTKGWNKAQGDDEALHLKVVRSEGSSRSDGIYLMVQGFSSSFDSVPVGSGVEISQACLNAT